MPDTEGIRLTEHEWQVLKMLTGERPGEWGAWVGACLQFLAGLGLCTHGPNYQITDKGRAALQARKGEASHA